ncbi:MAG TPA: non-homologous end-joining DNA ligase [Thermoanaerobaculia bacterium]|nr:non-homologous end-joining DNA ligase [Thermoanaerobaculia bacterium]
MKTAARRSAGAAASARAAAARVPFRAHPMLATLVSEPFHRKGWVYEEKYDGYRILAYKEGDRVTLLSRNAKNRTETFAEVAEAIAGLRDAAVLLDGEVVAFDKRLVSRFQLLQQGEVAQVYAVFDCLYRNGRDLRGEPLPVRRAALEESIGRADRLFPSRRLPGDGFKAFELATKKGWEGLVAKNPEAPYVEGRSTQWLKVKVHQEEELVVGGYTPPAGSRSHFGALLMGAYRGRELRYVGKVGTGYTQKLLTSLYKTFQPLVRAASPFVNPPREKGAVWLAPKLVAQVNFQEWTADGKLRQPVFLGLRDDKKPEECVLPEDIP